MKVLTSSATQPKEYTSLYIVTVGCLSPNAYSSGAVHLTEPPIPELKDDIAGSSKSLASTDRPKSVRHAVWFSSIRTFA